MAQSCPPEPNHCRMDRRTFLGGAGAGAAAVAAAPHEAHAISRAPLEMPKDAVGMLYDSALCIGCQACVDACRTANGVPTKAAAPSLLEWNAAQTWDTTYDLDGKTLNVIKAYRHGTAQTKDQAENGFAFMKRHCLHCVDPSCISVCPVSALTKDPVTGIVGYNKDACIGCRYCSYACPFGVPQFDLSSAFGQINKCEMCRHLQAKGGIPACCDVCPTGASLFGPVADLQNEADRRLAAKPGSVTTFPRGDIRQDRPRHEAKVPHYVQHVYGVTEVGGTQVRYLSAIPHEKLGLPVLSSFAPARLAEGVQHTVYKYMVAPVLALIGVAFLVRRNKLKAARAAGDKEA